MFLIRLFQGHGSKPRCSNLLFVMDSQSDEKCLKVREAKFTSY